jgi:sarcosine oxidase subunit alpha
LLPETGRGEATGRQPRGHWQHPSPVGLLDASTLGKILVKGPDAGRFLDMLYTNMMSTLPGQMPLWADVLGERLPDRRRRGGADRRGHFLCHTTTGGAERIHGHMEDWLQCEWWDWKVYTANLTEQYAQIAVVGPRRARCWKSLGGMDVSKEALPFMGWADGKLGGFPARVYRISFSGELSPTRSRCRPRRARPLGRADGGGRGLGIMPYGTEALHVMRAEKGFIMIGDETDGTVIPQDLGLDWAISKKKDDYLGKRAQDAQRT